MDGAELLVHERIVHEQKGGIKILDDNAVIGQPQPQIDADDVNAIDSPPNNSDTENTDPVIGGGAK